MNGVWRLLLCFMVLLKSGIMLSNTVQKICFYGSDVLKKNECINSQLVIYMDTPLVSLAPIEKIDTTMRSCSFLLSPLTCPLPLLVHVQKNIERYEDSTGVFWGVKMTQKGLLCTITYNKNNFVIAVEQMVSIKNSAVLVVRVYNKKYTLASMYMDNTSKKNIKTPMVVIDCGHGGDDVGAIGVAKIPEKDIVRIIGEKVACILRDQYDSSIYFARNDDDTVSFDERVCVGNTKNADCLVSIHANYSQNTNAQGIETFVLDKKIGEKARWYGDISLDNKKIFIAYQERLNALSKRLAHLVHNNVVPKNGMVVDRGIKSSVTQLFLGSYIPTILVEVGFLSHSIEGFLLTKQWYQDYLAYNIAKGIMRFVRNK